MQPSQPPDRPLRRHDLVRLTTRASDEPMIVGGAAAAKGSVRCYKWSDEHQHYVFAAEYPSNDLRFVGSYLSKPPPLIG